ncbi:MAG: hypothetical protein PHH75_01190 [Candidatus Omnitrophica bacterium]|nr:hypothetical protein [Candidatus Omnitrophota bacterium]MDD5573772.1 hypothetical protein [Candidatus Omnitrophota bacterium]
MIKFLIIPVIVVLEYFFHRFFCVSWFLFDPLLAAAVVYTFFHSLEARGFVFYALWCGFWRDAGGTDLFGVFMISYLLTVFGVSYLVRVLYRHNWMFIFPVVFAAQLLNNHLVLVLRLSLGGIRSTTYAYFLGRTLLQAFGTTALVYPLFLFFKKCAPEPTA